jgi:hypothetical protein
LCRNIVPKYGILCQIDFHTTDWLHPARYVNAPFHEATFFKDPQGHRMNLDSAQIAPGPSSSTPVARRPTNVRYTVWILMAVATLNILDRQIINVLAEQIRRELGLSDTQSASKAGRR